jgi:heme oxygenase (mycobilin-producing)
MFVVISKFTVDNKENMTASVKQAYVERPHLVENAAGFLRLDVLSPMENPDEIWLLTYWTDQTSFQEWYCTHRYKDAHANIPAGLKLISDQTKMLFFEHISS